MKKFFGRVKTGSANLKFQIVLKRYTFAIEKEIKNYAKIDLLTRISEKPAGKTDTSVPRRTRRKTPASADSYGGGV